MVQHLPSFAVSMTVYMVQLFCTLSLKTACCTLSLKITCQRTAVVFFVIMISVAIIFFPFVPAGETVFIYLFIFCSFSLKNEIEKKKRKYHLCVHVQDQKHLSFSLLRHLSKSL